MTLTVRLEPSVTKNSAAGMLFRHSADSYYAFALGAGHTLMYLEKSGNHIKIASTWTLDGVADGDPVTLRIEGHGKELWLFVKDKRIDIVADASGSGDPGIFAMGRVCARFDEVSVALPLD